MYGDAADLVIAISAALKPTKDSRSRLVNVSSACYSDFEGLSTMLHLVYLSARVLMAATPGLSAVVRLPSGVGGYTDVPAALEAMLQAENDEFTTAMMGTRLASSTGIAPSPGAGQPRPHELQVPAVFVMSNGSRLAVVQNEQSMLDLAVGTLSSSAGLPRLDIPPLCAPWVVFYLDATFGDCIDGEEAETLLRSTEGKNCSGAVVLVYDTSHVEFPASRPFDPSLPHPFPRHRF